jgi:pimeloyl-ACP methyl ester carboxylesterase
MDIQLIEPPVRGRRALVAAAPAAWTRSAAGAPGDAPAVLLVHGAGMDHGVWSAQLRDLGAAGLRAFAPDLPGHGRSEGPALPSVEEMGRWLVDLIDALGCGRAVLCGHSMGALAALAAARAAPGRAAGLALLGAGDRMAVNADLLDLARADPPAANRLLAKWSLSRGADPAAAAALAGSMDRAAAGTLHADLAACDAWPGPRGEGAPPGCPVLAVLGSADRMAPPEGGRRLAAALGGRVVEIEGAGHMMTIEAPGAVSAALVEAFGNQGGT